MKGQSMETNLDMKTDKPGKRKIRWPLMMLGLALLVMMGVFAVNHRGVSDIVISENVKTLALESSAFEDMGFMPARYTGRGEDVSPDLKLLELPEGAESIAVIMDDLDIPFVGNFTHWVIWNLPATLEIPEGISHGAEVSALGGAIQGLAYGRHQYKGPNPPFGTHRYQFHVFVLDGMLELSPEAGKTALLEAMEGHILGHGVLTGRFSRRGE